MMDHIGHVEKTNDRDYEIEERYDCLFGSGFPVVKINVLR